MFMDSLTQSPAARKGREPPPRPRRPGLQVRLDRPTRFTMVLLLRSCCRCASVHSRSLAWPCR